MKAYKPFSRLSVSPAPADAKGAIMKRVSALALRAYYARVSSLGILAIASITGFVASCAYAWQAVASSGFGEYTSLVFSDGTAAFSKELGYALIESLPALGMALVLVTASIAIWSVSKVLSRRGAGSRAMFA